MRNPSEVPEGTSFSFSYNHMDLLIIFLVAILVFAVFVAITAFFLKSALEVHSKTTSAVRSHGARLQPNSPPADSKKK